MTKVLVLAMTVSGLEGEEGGGPVGECEGLVEMRSSIMCVIWVRCADVWLERLREEMGSVGAKWEWRRRVAILSLLGEIRGRGDDIRNRSVPLQYGAAIVAIYKVPHI